MTPPDKPEWPPKKGPDRNSLHTTTAGHHSNGFCQSKRTGGHRRVAAGWRRKAWLSCGCFDPCRCGYRNAPSLKRVDAYADAVAWLEGHGLPPAPLMPESRAMWSRGGSDRVTASRVVRRWAA